MGTQVLDQNWPAAAAQDNIVGRMKQTGLYGGSGPGNVFGSASNAGSVVSFTDASSNTSGSVQSTEYSLNSITLPANAFNATGRALRVTAWGTLAANANAKNLKIYFGSSAVATVTGSVGNGVAYFIYMTVIRTGASTQSAVATIMIDTGTAVTMAQTTATAQTDTAAIIVAVKSANTAAAATSGTGNGLVATFLN